MGRTKEEAARRLEKTLSVMEDHGLKLKTNKCKFLKEEVSYLGPRIGSEGLKTDPKKVKVVLEAQTSTNEKELKEFLGAVTFYGRVHEELVSNSKTTT